MIFVLSLSISVFTLASYISLTYLFSNSIDYHTTISFILCHSQPEAHFSSPSYKMSTDYSPISGLSDQ